ncbi:MAG: AAA family ATPase [Treponema sp.]|nr:AAA family ATPase [Treponema sp.]
MLKRLSIKNFKIIQDMTIELTPFTVFIGENSCGKSTILQVLDFLRSAAFRDIPEYLRERGWSYEELLSDSLLNKPVELVTTWNFLINGSIETIEWTLSVNYINGWIIKEKIIRHSDKKIILSYNNEGLDNIPSSLGQLNIQSSALKYISGSAVISEEINKLIYFLGCSTNLELLSPEKMRSGKKTTFAQNIGIGGETLAYVINNMSNSDKQRLNEIVSDLAGSNIEILTSDLGNKIKLSIIIKTKNNSQPIDSIHISDGLLRIIAFVVITMEEKTIFISTDDGSLLVTDSNEFIVADSGVVRNGMILLDEIENGINPYITDKIIALLYNLKEEKIRQVIVTTHSPIILNEVKPEDIVFLWKDENGRVFSKKFFDTEEMREALAFLNPGEIWENFGKEAILSKLGVKPEN